MWEIRRALKVAGLAHNTLLVFASDNGYVPRDGSSAGLLKGTKATTFEKGKEFLVFSGGCGPYQTRRREHAIGSLMDIYATALSLAGVAAVADDIDSIDLSPFEEELVAWPEKYP